MEANESLAYIAGFLDGEGCIMIRKYRSKYNEVCVQITNSNLEVLEHIAVLLEGSRLYNQKRYGRKEIWRVVLTNKWAVHNLELLFPYLIVKKEVAKLAIDYYYLDRNKDGYRKVLSDIEIMLCDNYAKTISGQNRG